MKGKVVRDNFKKESYDLIRESDEKTIRYLLKKLHEETGFLCDSGKITLEEFTELYDLMLALKERTKFTGKEINKVSIKKENDEGGYYNNMIAIPKKLSYREEIEN